MVVTIVTTTTTITITAVTTATTITMVSAVSVPEVEHLAVTIRQHMAAVSPDRMAIMISVKVVKYTNATTRAAIRFIQRAHISRHIKGLIPVGNQFILQYSGSHFERYLLVIFI